MAGKNDEVMEFLGVEKMPLASDLKKINPDNLSELVNNFDDVRAALSGTRYEKYLDL
jgi:hypothetical protein